MAGGATGDSNGATNEHRTPDYALGVRLFVLALSCAAVALLATGLFFLLHHLGNQIPYDLAAQRLKAEFESDRPDPGHAKGYKIMLEYCTMSSGVLAGARQASKRRFEFTMDFVSGRAVVAVPEQSSKAAAPLADAGRASSPHENENAFRNAVLPKTFQEEHSTICGQLEDAVNGAAIPKTILLTRYWWGSKALYAIALRFDSVYEIRRLTRIGIYFSYMLLAISLFLLSPKMLLPAAPLLVFGAFFSGIEYWADVANGLPYLWTVLFAAGLALLMRLTRAVASGAKGGEEWRAAWSGAVPVYCFAAGTVSSYLWLMDGHVFLAVTWIGMVVWFGHDSPNAAERSKRALSCIVLYGAGIVVCYTLGQLVKAMFLGDVAWLVFRSGAVGIVEESAGGPSRIWTTHPLAHLDSFYAAYWPSWLPSGVVPTFVAVLSLAASLCFAVFETRRGRAGQLWGALWIVGLMASSSLTFLIVDDLPYRVARYMFVPLALCLSCLLLSVPPLLTLQPLRTTHWRMSLATARKRSAILLGLFVFAWAVSWYLATFKSRAVGEMIGGVEGMRPLASSSFDVYLDEDRLVYVKEECSAEDVDAMFFLHVHPADVANLPLARQPHGFANLDFAFERFGRLGGGRCAAVRPLPICVQSPCLAIPGWPPYELVAIRTGQYVPGEGREWDEHVVLPDAVDKVIASVERRIIRGETYVDKQPTVSASFDVYLDREPGRSDAYGAFLPGVDRLVYVKKACSDEDVDVPFFLHLYPVDVADLPPHRRPHGFANLDFAFEAFGFRGGGRCAAVRLLPDYEAAAIRTGQYVHGEGPEWSVRIHVAFDVSLDGGRLVYVKEECYPEDVDTRFFLRLYPADVADLPPELEPGGFDIVYFSFEEFGSLSGGRCTVERLLPDYDVVAIETGQYVPDWGPVWERRIDLASAK